MPLIVKDFTWEQTNKVVFITVPLKGVKANKVDIFSSEEYLKVCILSHCTLYNVSLLLPCFDGIHLVKRTPTFHLRALLVRKFW
jgi:hypothetical protein